MIGENSTLLIITTIASSAAISLLYRVIFSNENISTKNDSISFKDRSTALVKLYISYFSLLILPTIAFYIFLIMSSLTTLEISLIVFLGFVIPAGALEVYASSDRRNAAKKAIRFCLYWLALLLVVASFFSIFA